MKKRTLLNHLRNIGDEAEILIVTPNNTDIKNGVYKVGRVTELGTKGTSLYSPSDPLFIEIGEKYKQ